MRGDGGCGPVTITFLVIGSDLNKYGINTDRVDQIVERFDILRGNGKRMDEPFQNSTGDIVGIDHDPG